MKTSLVALAFALGVSIIFLQVGFTYYLSVQTFAMFLVIAIVFKNRPVMLNSLGVLLSVLLFALFLALTESRVPAAISENSDNMLFTSIGIVGYAALILAASNLAFPRPEIVLRILRVAATLTILISVGLIVVADLGVSSVITRESLILQNVTLITNYTTSEVLTDNFAYLRAAGLRPDIDLFYGEQSFLSVVIFACVTCRVICEKLIAERPNPQMVPSSAGVMSAMYGRHGHTFVIALGLGVMIYIQSFSSFFYVIVVCVSLFFSVRHRFKKRRINLMNLLMMLVAFVLLVQLAVLASEYYTQRVSTVSDSLSFEQRFASFFEFDVEDYLLGMVDASKMPRAGFHNSIIYTIAISGIAGICLLTFMVWRVYALSRVLKIPALAVACILGIFSQNGAVFSPNKVVILSLVLLPLACVDRSKRKQPVSQQALSSHV